MWETWTQHDRLLLWARTMREIQAVLPPTRLGEAAGPRRQVKVGPRRTPKAQTVRAPRYFTP